MFLCLSKYHLLFLIIFFTSRTTSRPTEDEDSEAAEGITISDDAVKEVIHDLVALVTKIPIEHFNGDTKLCQVVDGLNDATSYRANGTTRKSLYIYERNVNDKGKKVVILNPSEDKIIVHKSKKTYVGLRHSEEGDAYYVFYIYLRDAASDEEGAKKIGGENKIVEFDAWENREDKLQKVNNGFGWNECSSSIFIPCKTTDKVGFAKPRLDHRPKKVEDEMEESSSTPKPEHQAEGTFKTEDGFDVYENIDFFWDLEEDIQKARAISVGLDLTAGLTAIPNLLTGVFGGVAEGVTGLLSGVLGTAGQLVSGVISTGAQAFSGLVGAAGNLVTNGLGSILNIGGGLFGGGGGDGAGGGGMGGIGVGISAGIGSGINIGIDLGGKFLEGMTNMVTQGINAGINAGVGILNTGVSLMGAAGNVVSTVVGTAGKLFSGVVGGVASLVKGFFQAGLGLVNSLLSFGGLGSKSAKPDDVGTAIGINLGLGGRQMVEDDDTEVQRGIQRPHSGGMGGLLSLDLSLENEAGEDGAAQGQGRSVGNAIPLTEKDKAILENRALLTIKLAELIALKMGEKFGKELLKTGLIEHPGWKTMDEAGAPGNTLQHEEDAFVGFGGCEYKQVTKHDYESATTATEILTVLTTALRTQCVAKEKKFYEKLVGENFLKLNDDRTFDVPRDNKYLQMAKLCPQKRSELTRAFEMSLFSKAFKAEVESSEPHSAPHHSAISRRVHTLGEVVINGIDEVHKGFKHHEIKILRSLLTTVKAAFTKLIQDYQVTRECGECEEELRIHRNDETYLMTLMEFILHGLAPVHKNSESAEDALKKFNHTNAHVITNRVDGYLL